MKRDRDLGSPSVTGSSLEQPQDRELARQVMSELTLALFPIAL